MSTLNTDGMLIDDKISLKRYSTIEHGNLTQVSAVVVHQTDAPSAQHFTLTKTDVYRHPEVSYKNPGEAKGASW